MQPSAVQKHAANRVTTAKQTPHVGWINRATVLNMSV
jgi:hypothetical protein